MQWVFKQAIPSGESIVLASQYGPIRQDQALEQLEVVFFDWVADVNGSAGDGSRGGMELGTWVGGLEHVPVWVYEVAHPQAVVGTVDHVTTL